MEIVINWFKNNWFLWLFIIITYVVIRLLGYDIKIENSNELFNANGVGSKYN